MVDDTVPDISPAGESLSHLKTLEPSWDGEDAPPPSHEAIELAERVIVAAARLGVLPFEVEADVLGGVAVWFESADHSRRVWVACLNQRPATVIFTDSSSGIRRASRFQLEEASEIHSFVSRRSA